MDDFFLFPVRVGIVLLSIAMHEFAHAKSADAAGDPTPRLQGRVTLNPAKHWDPLGTLLIIVSSWTGFGIGWGKPVMVSPDRMKHPRWDYLMSVAWGPFTNVLIALACALVLRYVPITSDFAHWALAFTIVVNLGLAFFNLIPLFPLDGSWIVTLLLPGRKGTDFLFWNMRFGMIVLFALIFVPPLLGIWDPLDHVLWPAVMRTFSFLVGSG